MKTKNHILLGATIGIIVIVYILFYIYMNNLMYKKNKIYAQNIMVNVKENIDSNINNVLRIGSAIAYEKNVQEFMTTYDMATKMELESYIENMIHTCVDYYGPVSNISLINQNGDSSTFFSSYQIDEYNFLKKIYASIQENEIKQSKFIISTEYELDSSNIYYCYVVPSYSIDSNSNPNKQIGSVVILCKIESFKSIIQKLNLSQGSDFMLVDGQKRIIVSNRAEQGVATVVLEKFNKLSKNFVSTMDIQGTDWKIISKIEQNEFSEDLKSISLLFFLLGAFLLFILLLNSILFNKIITKPLEKVVKAISNVGKNNVNIKQRIDLPIDNELGIITTSINELLDRIEGMTKNIFQSQTKLYEMELSKKQSALSALQNQINPHFLYNTLECVQCIGIAYNVSEVAEIATAMADIFRYSIKSSDIVFVKDEIKIINEYLKIMNIRFCGKFNVTLDIEDSIMEKRILKMILQPIVENSMYHGLEKKDGQGNLDISGRVLDDFVVFEIKDDGHGMSSEELDIINVILSDTDIVDEPEGNKSIGLQNVNKRIKIHFGNDFGIKVDSTLGEGTIVKIILPSNF
jgi:two-component system sensor histidine kinase YesM